MTSPLHQTRYSADAVKQKARKIVARHWLDSFEKRDLARDIAAALQMAYREGLEDGAQYHDAEVERLSERIAENREYCQQAGIISSEAIAYCLNLQDAHRRSAAAIRAMKEGA